MLHGNGRLCNHYGPLAGIAGHTFSAPLLTLLVTALYIAAAAAHWSGALRPSVARGRLIRALVVAALAIHTVDLSSILRNEAGFALSIGDALSLWGWVIAVSTLLAGFFWPLKGAPAFLYGLVAVLASFAAEPRTYHEAVAPGFAINVHIALSTLAAGWLSITAVCAVLLVVQSARLKARRMDSWVRVLPPVEILERAVFASLGAGFAALSVALITGLLFVYDLKAQHLSHKLWLSLLAWALFATLLVGRARYGWRGRTAARLTVGGFFALSLAYLGSKFVLEVVLGRHWG